MFCLKKLTMKFWSLLIYAPCKCLYYNAGMVVVHIGMLTPPTQQLRFVNQTYAVSVAEDSARGTVLVTVLARTSNNTVPVVYSLADGNDIFDINHNSGLFWQTCLIDWVVVSQSTRHNIGHFGDVLPSQGQICTFVWHHNLNCMERRLWHYYSTLWL